MGLLYRHLVRPILFQLDPETAHHLSVDALGFLGNFPLLCRLLESFGGWPPLSRAWPQSSGGWPQKGPIHAFGLNFPTPVGLAAGFDKNGKAWPAAAALGFGHVEIGTVTNLAQPGNPRPRLFRYPREEAVINRMGFNNEGASAVSARLARLPGPGRRRIPLGINLGKSKVVDLEKATEDYLASFGKLAAWADYLVLNVSSPNTPGLRALQEKARLRELVGPIAAANRARQASEGGRRVPLLLKIAPDLDFPDIDGAMEVVAEFGLDGVIATNTTLDRPGALANAGQAGGLSGLPARARSTEIIRHIARVTGGRLPIVGCGGISDAASAAEKLDAGAVLVQIYTGLIFRGPFLAREIARGLAVRVR